jgi:1-acyl-sn-glycerol-3-phosphate acyltransferase
MKALPSYPNPLLDGWRLPEDVPHPNPWYRFCRYGYQILAAMMWRLEVFNRHFEPASGSVLYLCNHQSFLDPALMGMGLRRPVNYMARDSLFRQPLFGRFITSLNAFPVRRGHADTGAMKEGLRRLKAGGQLVVFPEGTRTRDGRIGPFLPGVSLLARRAAEWVVPMVIDGAFEIWPRTSPLPGMGHIEVAYCRPLGRDELDRLEGDDLLAACRERMIEMQAQLRRRIGRPKLRYDK